MRLQSIKTSSKRKFYLEEYHCLYWVVKSNLDLPLVEIVCEIKLTFF